MPPNSNSSESCFRVKACCSPCSGTASHRSGGRSFPRHHGTMPLGREVERPLEAGRVPDVNAIAKAMKKLASSLVGASTRQQKALEEARAQVAESVLNSAAEAVSEVVESSRFLRAAMSWKSVPHRCPMLSGSISATEACDPKSDLAKTTCASRAAAWHTRHLGVKAPAAQNIKGLTSSDCMQAGICVCGSSTRTFWKAASGGVIKNVCAEKPSQEKLISGNLLLLWVGTAKPLDEGHIEELSEATLEATHIPWHYLKPWRPTFLKMEVKFSKTELVEAMRERLADPTGRGERDSSLEFACPEWIDMEHSPFMSHFAFLSTLDKRLHWSLAVLCLSQKCKPYPQSVGRVRAHFVNAFCIPFWNGPEEVIDGGVPWFERDVEADGVEFAPDDADAPEQAEAAPTSDARDGRPPELDALLNRAAAVESDSESSASSSSSSSSTARCVRENVAAPEEPQDAVEQVVRDRPRELTRQVHAATFVWGSFLFTHRGQDKNTAWQCTCRYHPGPDSSSRCTKTRGFKSQEESADVIRRLKSWALTATKFGTKQEHQGTRALPPMAAEHADLDDHGLDQLLAEMPPLP